MDATKVKIKELEPNRTRSSTYGPDAPMRQFYFKLEGLPDHAWATIFTDVNKRHIHMRKRPVWTEGTYLIVDCTQEELPEQLEILKQLVEESNAKYATWLAQEEAEAEKRRQAHATEQESLRDLAKKLNFD